MYAREEFDRFGGHREAPQYFTNSHQYHEYLSPSAQGSATYEPYPPYDGQTGHGEAYEDCICYDNHDSSCLFPVYSTKVCCTS